MLIGKTGLHNKRALNFHRFLEVMDGLVYLLLGCLIDRLIIVLGLIYWLVY